jgi:hypothetical protein
MSVKVLFFNYAKNRWHGTAARLQIRMKNRGNRLQPEAKPVLGMVRQL